MTNKPNGQRHKEGVNPSPEYFSGYVPRNIESQIARLREFFPQLEKVDISIALNQVLPPGAEGWFAIPRWKKIARTYNEALEEMLKILDLNRGKKFFNWREGYIGPTYLRERERAQAGFQKLADQQAGKDIIIVPAQFGLRHTQYSPCKTFNLLNEDAEFGLNSFAISCMILTHPERLKHVNDLWIHCIGDECRDDESSKAFSKTPSFRFTNDMLKFGAGFCENIDPNSGSPTGFLLS